MSETLTIEDLNPGLGCSEREYLACLNDGDSLEVYRTDDGLIRGIVRDVKIQRDLIHPNAWNPNGMNDDEVGAIRGSVGGFGMISEIICAIPEGFDPTDPHYMIVDGEQRWTNTASGKVMPVNLIFGFTEDELMEITLAMDKAVGRMDPSKLKAALDTIQRISGKTPEQVTRAVPFSMDAAAALANAAQASEAEEFQEPPAPEKPNNDEWRTITMAVPLTAMPVIEAARNRVEQIRDGDFDANPKVVWGLVLEALAADFIGGA